MKQGQQQTASKHRFVFRLGFTGLLLLLWSVCLFPQPRMIVYDGYTGIHDVGIQADTVLITTLIPGSPAEKAGLRLGDQILAIDGIPVSGRDKSRREVRQLLQDQAGKFIDLKIKRGGVQHSFHLQRDTYLYQIDSDQYSYLVDSLNQWTIGDIMSPSLDTLFKDPLKTKITVFHVEEGSPAEINGILPGDEIISLADEVDQDHSYHISYDRLSKITPDTSIAFLREDTLMYFFLLEPSLQGDLKGITSQFEHDFSFPCVWLKITTENRLASSRDYIFNIPELASKDSLSFYTTLPTGELVEKKSGILIPVQDRDYIYKNWHAAVVSLIKGEEQTFYLRIKAKERVGGPHLQIYARETMVNYDRYERIVLFGFLFTMLFISAFFLVLFAVMHARQYLYFALYVGSLVLFLFITDGYLDEYFWKENNFFLKFLEKFQPYIMSWISIFFLLFGIAYLELRRTLPVWYRAVLIVLSLTGFRILLVVLEVVFSMSYPSFIEDVIRIVWIFTVGIIPLFILILPAIRRIREGFFPAWYFLAANLVLIPLIYVTLYSSLYSNTVITISETIFGRIFLTSGMYIAAILQIVIFSFGIARKMRLDELEKKRIQEEIIEQLRVNERLKDQVNLELENKVQERTREISEQKREITDSISYAQRIQDAVLPRKEYLDQVMPDYFILYKPKDIVSGDFYWIREVKDSLVVVAADCTGHGVPGAFMSMLGITLLNEQLAQNRLDDPGKILDNMRAKVKDMLVQRGKTEEQKDGMEMAVAILHKEKRLLHFAGANHRLLLVRRNSQLTGEEPESEGFVAGEDAHLYDIKGDMQPIGFYWEETAFTNHHIHLKEQDSLYVFTDGFIDQFGGEQRKKFKIHRFKELLLTFQQKSMNQQKLLLEDAFTSWRGDIEQIDDVCIIGIRI